MLLQTPGVRLFDFFQTEANRDCLSDHTWYCAASSISAKVFQRAIIICWHDRDFGRSRCIRRWSVYSFKPAKERRYWWFGRPVPVDRYGEIPVAPQAKNSIAASTCFYQRYLGFGCEFPRTHVGAGAVDFWCFGSALISNPCCIAGGFALAFIVGMVNYVLCPRPGSKWIMPSAMKC